MQEQHLRAIYSELEIRFGRKPDMCSWADQGDTNGNPMRPEAVQELTKEPKKEPKVRLRKGKLGRDSKEKTPEEDRRITKLHKQTQIIIRKIPIHRQTGTG